MNNVRYPYCDFFNSMHNEFCNKCPKGLHVVYQPSQAFPNQTVGDSCTYPYPVHNNGKSKEGALAGKVVALAVAVVLLVSVLMGGVAVLKHKSKTQWREFQPSGSRMVVMMPGEPKELQPVVRELSMGTMTNHIYSSSVGSGKVTFCFVDFPLETKHISVENALEEELNNLMSKTNSTLITKRRIILKGYKGIEFEAKPTDDASSKVDKTFGRVYITGNQMYLLILSADDKSELRQNIDKFLNPVKFQ